jgi:hypothetical protein
MRRWIGRALCAMALTGGRILPATAQQPATPPGPVGTVIGQVVAADTKAPLQSAQVLVLGTTLRAGASAEGRFVIRNVPVGSHTVRAQLLGFAPKEQQVSVTAGWVSRAKRRVSPTPRHRSARLRSRRSPRRQ